jgi:hypothetical protein
MDAPSLYETDILEWSEQQAAVLRALVARADRPNGLDFENVVDEIESVGRSQLRAVESHLRLILEHLVKLASAPDSPAAGDWTAEILNWRAELEATISPSMHQRVDLDRCWRKALEVAEARLASNDHSLQPGLPAACPVPLPDLLAPRFDIPAVAARIGAATEGVR